MEEFVPFYQHITDLYKAAYHPLYQSFSSHTTFGIAKQKVQAAFDNISYNCPLNGSRNQWQSFYDSMTPFEQKVYFEYPKATGWLKVDCASQATPSVIKIPLLQKDRSRNVTISARYQITFNATADAGYTLLSIETPLWTSRLEFYHNGAVGRIRLTNSLATVPTVNVLTITSGVAYTLTLSRIGPRIVATVNDTKQEQAIAQADISAVKFADAHSSAANLPTRVVLSNLQFWRDTFADDATQIASGSQKRPPWPGLYDLQQQDNARLTAFSLPTYQNINANFIANDVATQYYFSATLVSYSASNVAQGLFFTNSSGFTTPLVPVINPVLAATKSMFEGYYVSASNHDDQNEFCIQNNLPPAMVASGGAWLTKLSNAAVDLIDATITENSLYRTNVLVTSSITNYNLSKVSTLDEPEYPEIGQQEYLNGLLAFKGALDAGGVHKSYVQYVTSSLIGTNRPATGAGRTWFKVADTPITVVDGTDPAIIGYNSNTSDNNWILQAFTMPNANATTLMRYGDIYDDVDNAYFTATIVRVGAQALIHYVRFGPASAVTTATSSSFYVKPGQLVHVAHRVGPTFAVSVAVDGIPSMYWTSTNTIYATGSLIFEAGPDLIYRDLLVYMTATTTGTNALPSWTSDFSSWQMWGAKNWFRVAPLTASSAWISHGSYYGDASALGSPVVEQLYVTPSLTSGFNLSGTALMSRNLSTAHNSAQLLHQVDNINVLDPVSQVNPSTPWITSTSALYFHNAHNEYNALVDFPHQGDRRADRVAFGKAVPFGL